MGKLNIGLWNVHGLNNGKLNDPDRTSIKRIGHNDKKNYIHFT
jgi:hypothetical protein